MYFHSSALVAAALIGTRAFAFAEPGDEKKKEPAVKPCTIRSSTTGNYFDLGKLYVEPPKKDDKQTSTKTPESWHVKGYDYGANFTLNFCGPVVEDLEDVMGIGSAAAKNVSAYYTKDK